MVKCSKCEKKRKGSEKFCVSCGTPFADEQLEKQTVDQESDHEKSRASSKPKKGRIAFVISAILVVLALLGAHLFLQSEYDVSNNLVDMNRAYIAGDETEFLGYFEVPENVTGSAAGFYAFIEEEGWENLRDEIKSESVRLKEEGLSNVILDSEGNKLLSVIEKPAMLGLYKEVSFLVHPTAVEMEFPFDDTTFTIGEQTIKGKKGEQAEIGSFLPGSYEWEANVASPYGEIVQKGSMYVMGAGKNEYIHSPVMEAGFVEVTSDVPEAILLVNGKSMKKTVAELKSIGPILMDGSVEVSAETKNDAGEALNGNLVKVDGETVHIEFAHIQEQAKAERAQKIEEKKLQQIKEEHEYYVTDLVESFRNSFESALNYADFSYIANYFPTGSKVQGDYIAEIDRHYEINDYYTYEFQSNTITGLDVIDETTFVVTTAEMFYFSSAGDRYKYNKTKAYTVIYQNGQYYIQAIDQLTSDKVNVY